MTAKINGQQDDITGKVGVLKGRSPKWRLGLLLGLAAVVLVAGGFFAWYKLIKSNTPVQNQTAIAAAQAQANAGNTSAALKILNTAISNTRNASQKSELYTQEGDIYANSGQTAQAFKSYQMAAQYGPLTYEEASLLGRMAQLSGNKQLAIQYYKKAIDLIPSNYPLAIDEKQSLQENITRLEGGGN